MSKDAEPDWALLTAYLSGEVTPGARAAVRQWIGERPEHQALLRDLQEASYVATRAVAPPFTLATLEGKVLPAIIASSIPVSPVLAPVTPASLKEEHRDSDVRSGTPRRWDLRTGSGQRRATLRRGIGAGIGAIALAAVLTIGMLWHEHTAAQWVAGKVYSTTRGQRAVATLPDGSEVTLAPQTTLVLASTFGTRTRAIRLTGEAYFKVASSNGIHAPFVVQSGAATTRVLGTAFDVRHYSGDRDTRIVVVQGRVSTSTNAAQTVTLAAGNMGWFADSTANIVLVSDAAKLVSWTDGRLTFDEAPVMDVLSALGHWYGIRFDLIDSTVARRHVTAVFDGTSRTGMLAALASLLNVMPVMTAHGDTTVVTLSPRHDSSLPPRRSHGGLDDSLLTSHWEYGR